jgi:predicted enzyme related to lactoylglutathione lyase
MAEGPPIGSLLLGSSQVEAMKDWYRRVFWVKENAMGAFEFGPVQYFIETHSDVSGPTKEPARIVINLSVENARALEADFRAKGVRFIRPVEQESFGLIGTVADPDGNYVQIIEWGAMPEAHKQA